MNKTKDFYSQLQKTISAFKDKPEIKQVGKIVEVGDGIAKVKHLSDAVLGEILVFPKGVKGLVFNLEKDEIGAIILGDYSNLKEGDNVESTGEVLKTPVGDDLLGRVVNPIGETLDNKGKLNFSAKEPYEKIAPGVIKRQSVDTPLQTGIIAIDSIIPIGRGQRELIVGDRKTGKTAIALDAIINQKDTDAISIYVGIGQKTSKIVRITETLKQYGAMDNSIVVTANASDSASLQYLAPYAACTMGEYFMNKGKEVLIVYDDLTKHAWAYRQISLLLKRPSGREAYPGDIFYLHSRLLERACKLSDEEGGGSITALPIIETQEGNVSAYVPTNVISITDGQIYLEKDLFNSGVRPAINVGLSVSRVGGAAQIKAMKQVAGDLKLELSQYRELEAFAQFGSELDERTRERLEKGEKLTELLKQPQFKPLSVEEQVILIWTAVNGHLKNIPTPEVETFKKEYLSFIEDSYPQIKRKIKKDGKITIKTEEFLKQATTSFLQKTNLVKKKQEKADEPQVNKLKRESQDKWLPLETSKEK